MNFSIADKVIKDYPNLRIGVVVAKNMNNAGSDPDIVANLRKAEAEVLAKYGDVPVSSHETIAEWRRTYKSFGAKDMVSSVESLVKRASKGKNLPDINKAVNIYNTISLRYFLPLGGEDIDKIEGDLTLMKATGDERFIPLMETENNPPKAEEIIYADDNDVICRAWNWREADKTKLTEDTKNAIFVVESLLENEAERFKKAVYDLSEQILNYCGGDCKVEILDKDRISAEA